MAGSMTDNAEDVKIAGPRKAAILMMALDQETASRLMQKMQREHVEEIAREIATTDSVSTETRTTVVREFYNMVLARQYMNMGGLSLARALLMKTMPPEEAKKIMAALEHQVYQEPFSFLQKTETESLLTFLAGEHPQTIALVLSHMPPTTASEILVGLGAEAQLEVIHRIATMDQTSPEVIKEVERGLEKRLSGLMHQQFERTGGVRAVAEILNLAGRATERGIIEGLSEQDPELVEEIRRLMFVFEDIMRVDDRGIQAVLKEVENEELSLALRTATEDLKEKIFSNMSERAAGLIKEEMEFMGPVRLSDVEAAQQKIVDIVRRLEDAGEIIISGGAGEQDLIV